MTLPIVDIFFWSALIFISVLLAFWGYSLYNRFADSKTSRRRYDD